MNMKSVIAIAAMIACRAAFAWAHCDIPMLSFCLPRKQETQLMQKMVEQVRDRSDTFRLILLKGERHYEKRSGSAPRYTRFSCI